MISLTPTKVGSVIVTTDGDSDKTRVTLYDGESTADPQIITIRTGTGVTNSVNFQPHMETQRGLYLEMGSHMEEVLVQVYSDAE